MSPDALAVADEPTSSIDELDRAICTLAARLNAVTHDFLVLIRRFDERAGWLGWGFERCADWLQLALRHLAERRA